MNSYQEKYQEYRPALALTSYVSCYWISTAPASVIPVERRVLPDGCIDIIFDLSPGQFSEGTVVGTMTNPLLFQTSGSIELVAVRFRPGGAVPFLQVAAEEITDSQCELPRAWQGNRLAERLHGENDLVGKLRLLETALLRRLFNVPPVDSRIRTAVSLIQQRHTIEITAKKLGLSRQHLTRLFRQHVGIGPKAFARVDRFQRLLTEIKDHGQPNWSSIGLDAGYYDQAHMITECRSLAGLTPTELADR